MILFSIFPAKAVLLFIPDKILFNQFELEKTPPASAVLLKRSEEEYCFMDARERQELLPNSIQPADLDSDLILDKNSPTNNPELSEDLTEIEECTWEEEQNHINTIARINDYGYLNDIVPFIVLGLLRVPPGIQLRIKPLLQFAGIGCFYGTMMSATTAFLISSNENILFISGFIGVTAALLRSLTAFYTASKIGQVSFIYSSSAVVAVGAALCAGGVYHYLTSKEEDNNINEALLEEILNTTNKYLDE